ncbi:MAG TPA: endonuclease/exonuclease/phosphatase family protein [Dokdonella sp.]|nr:endonuclease/exonuclease/phosphatase family protein [Dokdonella sp.]
MSRILSIGARQLSVRIWLSLAGACLLLALAGCAPQPTRIAEAPRPLKIATWNLEHLAESDGLGCRPRSEADYAALRRYADQLAADVIAFEEVENAAAARRVFPADRYSILMSTRPESGRHGYCGHGRTDGPRIRSQNVGFAIRKDVSFVRNRDFRELAVGNPDLRWGVDITLSGSRPLRLLAVHLKSGCSSGSENPPCPVLFDQVPVLRKWIAARRAEGTPFAILGDWNRRLALADDPVWMRLNEGLPAGERLVGAAGGRGATCAVRYPDFIDHIVLDPAAAARLAADSFEEFTYGVPEDQHPSDHCPVAVTID